MSAGGFDCVVLGVWRMAMTVHVCFWGVAESTKLISQTSSPAKEDDPTVYPSWLFKRVSDGGGGGLAWLALRNRGDCGSVG